MMALFSQVQNLVVHIYRTDGQQPSFVKYLENILLYLLGIRPTILQFNTCLKLCVKPQGIAKKLMLSNLATMTMPSHDGGTKVLRPFHIVQMMHMLPYGNLLMLGQSEPVILMPGSQKLSKHLKKDRQRFSLMNGVR